MIHRTQELRSSGPSAPRRHRRNPAVRRIDHHGHLPGGCGFHIPEGGVAPLRLVAPDAAQRPALSARRCLLGCQHPDVGQVVGPLERNTVRGIARPDPLEIRCSPRGPGHRVWLELGRDIHGRGHLGDHAGEPGLDDRQADVVWSADEGALGAGATTLWCRRLLQERHAVPTHPGRGRIEIVHREGDVVDRATGGGGRRAFRGHREQPDVAEPETVQTIPQPGTLTPEHLLIPRQRRCRVGRTQMDMVEPERVGVLHHLDAGAPRVEDEPVLEEPGHVAQRRAVREPLQPDPRASDANGLELGHLGRQVGVGEGDMVNAGALAGAQRRPRFENDLRPGAIDAVVTVRQRLTVQIPLVPLDRLGGVRGRHVHVVVIGRACQDRKRDERRRRKNEPESVLCPVHAREPQFFGALTEWALCGDARTAGLPSIRRT